MASLDFVVIGGQRCGTTSLYSVLSQVSDLRLPRDKEAPFLHIGGRTRDEFDAYMAATFGESTDGIRGSITPQYSAGAAAAPQLARFAPRAKLVLLHRDPLERAFSHYLLNRSRGSETREFANAVSQQLTARGRESSLTTLSETETYIAWSEFGRIARMYLDHFSPESLLLVPMNRLLEAPQQSTHAILNFVGSSTAGGITLDRLPSLNGRSGRARLAGAERLLRRAPSAKRLWRLLPEPRRRQIAFRVDQWQRSGTKQQVPPTMELPETVADAIGSHFAEDQHLLSSLPCRRL